MKRIFLFLATMSIVGCADVCSMKVTELTKLTNLTGSEVKIELCKVPYKREKGSTSEKVDTRSTIGVYTVSANQDGSFLADEYTSSYSKDKNKNCETGDDPSYSSQVFLTPTSISLFKLCRDDTDPTKATIVRRSAGCPTGSTSQAQAVASCDESALID